MFAGMTEITHGLPFSLSLSEVKRFTVRFICRNLFIA
jgi:hypothetical protein